MLGGGGQCKGAVKECQFELNPVKYLGTPSRRLLTEAFQPVVDRIFKNYPHGRPP
jgi:hypothetical protein